MKKQFTKTIFFMLMSCSLLAEVSISSSASQLDRKLSIPVEKYVLDNGLTVLLSQDHSLPFIATNVWYYVGSIDEQIKKTGLAHLFEHLMFEGSKHALDHFKLLERAGAFDINASTHFNYTDYYETLPKNQLELAISLESSRMFFLVIDQKRLDEQREVVRREREQRIQTLPYGNATLALWQAIFGPQHPFHGRVIGSHKDLKEAKLEDVQSFYDRYYGPSNASFALVGDFDKNEAKALINKYFASLPKTNINRTPILPNVVLANQEIIHYEEKLGKLPLIRIEYITPAIFEPGDAELDILSGILTGGEYGRLTKALTRDKQLASETTAYQQSLKPLSVFTINAMLNPGVNADEVLREIDNVLSDLVTHPPTTNEIDRARNAILTKRFFELQDIGGQSGRAELLQIYNRFANNPDFIKQDIMRYQTIGSKELQISASRYLPAGTARKILIATPVSNHVAQRGN